MLRDRLYKTLQRVWRILDIVRLICEGLEHLFNALTTVLEGAQHWVEAALTVLAKKEGSDEGEEKAE